MTLKVTKNISNSTTLDLKAAKFDLLCFLQSAFCAHSRPKSVYNFSIEIFYFFVEFLFCEFDLGSTKLNAEAVNPNANEV